MFHPPAPLLGTWKATRCGAAVASSIDIYRDKYLNMYLSIGKQGNTTDIQEEHERVGQVLSEDTETKGAWPSTISKLG